MAPERESKSLKVSSLPCLCVQGRQKTSHILFIQFTDPRSALMMIIEEALKQNRLKEMLKDCTIHLLLETFRVRSRLRLVQMVSCFVLLDGYPFGGPTIFHFRLSDAEQHRYSLEIRAQI